MSDPANPAVGTWLLTIETPMGEQSITVAITGTGNKLGGTMTGPAGTVPLSDVKLTGETLRWKAKMTKPMPMTMSVEVTIDGDDLSGTFKPGLFPKGKVRGCRA